MAAILLIYTGGTIGMVQDAQSKQLRPFDFSNLYEQVPELKKFYIRIDSVSFKKPIDSSDMQPANWVEMAETIKMNYDKYDGFVILHGSDTMSFTASALSFMLENLARPVVLTGSQLPIGIIRTDGKENLITAIEIASAKENGVPVVPEVCIYFEYKLYRGNRTHKYNAEQFNAFQSPNFPELAEAGVHLKFNRNAVLKPTGKKLNVHTKLDANIAVLKIFPGINHQAVSSVLGAKDLRAVVLETFGAGNASTQSWFIQELESAIKKGIIIYNVTQCDAGSVEQGKYQTSAALKKIGVTGGADITTEAAVTKLMFLLGQELNVAEITKQLQRPLRGELTENQQ